MGKRGILSCAGKSFWFENITHECKGGQIFTVVGKLTIVF